MPITLRSIVNLLGDVIDIFWVGATLVVVGFIVWGGVQMAMSQGDPGKFKTGKDTLIKAIIGGIVIFGVSIIVNTLASIGEDPTRILR